MAVRAVNSSPVMPLTDGGPTGHWLGFGWSLGFLLVLRSYNSKPGSAPSIQVSSVFSINTLHFLFVFPISLWHSCPAVSCGHQQHCSLPSPFLLGQAWASTAPYLSAAAIIFKLIRHDQSYKLSWKLPGKHLESRDLIFLTMTHFEGLIECLWQRGLSIMLCWLAPRWTGILDKILYYQGSLQYIW